MLDRMIYYSVMGVVTVAMGILLVVACALWPVSLFFRGD